MGGGKDGLATATDAYFADSCHTVHIVPSTKQCLGT